MTRKLATPNLIITPNEKTHLCAFIVPFLLILSLIEILLVLAVLIVLGLIQIARIVRIVGLRLQTRVIRPIGNLHLLVHIKNVALVFDELLVDVLHDYELAGQGAFTSGAKAPLRIKEIGQGLLHKANAR